MALPRLRWEFDSPRPLHKIKSSHQAMLMIKSTQVDFFVAIVKKGVIWYDKSRKEKNQYE